MDNMMNRLFSHISSDESILDKRNNEHSANQQPKKGEVQKSNDSTKHETTLHATCKRNFKTSRGLIQHQKKCRPSESTNTITIHNITVQTSTEIKIGGNLSIMDLQQVVSSTYVIYDAFRKGR